MDDYENPDLLVEEQKLAFNLRQRMPPQTTDSGGLAFTRCTVSGRHPGHAAKTTASCFLLFGAPSLFGFLQGEQSCGYFGHLNVNPVVTCVLDIAVCAVLLVA
jgi:hypothetical protein